MMPFPRILDPGATFNELVKWFDDMIRRGCPGVLVGLSGTDSLVTFLAAYQAFKEAGKPERVYGVHFAPSEDFLDDNPEAEAHLWFSREIIPWVMQQAPEAKVEVSTAIDWRYEGLRQGFLADLAVTYVDDHDKRQMRATGKRYWVSGTRNRSEDLLYRYSNVSLMVSLQPLIHLWKSEILQLSEYLGVPSLAVKKSCEIDCLCGRERLPAEHVRELDLMLMNAEGELSESFIERNIPVGLKTELALYIFSRNRGRFKTQIPYKPTPQVVREDKLLRTFEDGTLQLRGFNHRKHIYIAWIYLKNLPFEAALDRYCLFLEALLIGWNSTRFSREITESYFNKLAVAMLQNPNGTFDQVADSL